MLRLLEAELRYDRLRIGLILILSLVFFLVIWIGVKWERNRVPMVMLIVLVLTLTAVHAGEKYRISQERDRLHASLPVSLWQTGMTHLLYPALVLSAIIFLLFLSVLIVRPYVDYALTMPPLAHLLTLTGLVLAVNGVLLLQQTSAICRFFVLVFGVCDNKLYGGVRGKHSGATFSRPASGHSGRIHGGRPDSFVIESCVIRHKTILCRFLIERKVIP